MRTRLLWVLLALASCGKDSAKASDGDKQVASGAPRPAAPPTVALFVDDVTVASVTADRVGQWPRLDTLLPTAARRLGKWEDVYIKGRTPKPSQVHQPSASYPELVPALFPGDDGSPAFGMFDPVELAKHGKPSLREDGIHEIRIKLAQDSGRGEHEQGDGGGSDPNLIKISIKTPKGESTLEGPKLLAVPREPMPGGDELRGWTLATVLKIAGVTSYEKVILTDAAGLAVTLEKIDLDPKTSIPYVKLNRQGSLRIKVFKKKGTGWEGGGDLRGLAAIQVVK